MCAAMVISAEQEGGDEPADEAVEEAGLGQGEAEPLVALDVLRSSGCRVLAWIEAPNTEPMPAPAPAAPPPAPTPSAIARPAFWPLMSASLQREQRVEDRQEMEDQHVT